MLGRTSQGFCGVDLHFAIAILHLSFFFIHIFFSTSSLTLPWTIVRFLDPFCTFSPAHHRVIRDTFIFNYSVIFLPRALWFWVGIFYLMLLHDILAHLLLSRFHWEPAINFLKFTGLHSYWSVKYKSDPSVCLIHSNRKSFIHLKSVFIHVFIKSEIGEKKFCINWSLKKYISEHKLKIWNWKKIVYILFKIVYAGIEI